MQEYVADLVNVDPSLAEEPLTGKGGPAGKRT